VGSERAGKKRGAEGGGGGSGDCGAAGMWGDGEPIARSAMAGCPFAGNIGNRSRLLACTLTPANAVK
jgi:hypothetical protein